MPNIYGTANADTLVGTEGADTIYGYDGIDRIEGGAGDDRLYGGSGAGDFGQMGVNTLIGGTGNDSYVIQGTGNRTVEQAGGGIDRVYWTPMVGDQRNFYTTQAYVERIYIVRNAAFPDDGSDYFVLDGMATSEDGGNHLIFGGDQDDFYEWNGGKDTFYGGNGDDSVQVSNYNGILHQSDYLSFFGGDGDDWVSILPLTDLYFEGRDENDTARHVNFDGGSGYDELSLRAAFNRFGPRNISYKLHNVESITIEAANFGVSTSDVDRSQFTVTFITSLTNGSNYNPDQMDYTIYDLSHNLRVGGTHDVITIRGLENSTNESAANFWVYAGAGNDRVHFTASAAYYAPTPDVTLSIDLGTGADEAIIRGDNVTVLGGAGGDYIEVVGSNTMLNGGDGDDYIFVPVGQDNLLLGGDGKDTLEGSGTLKGGAGDDILIGGDGGNLYYGGAGSDLMYASNGVDRFIFLTTDLGATDTIFGFYGEEGDIIDLRNLVSGKLAWRGDLAFTGTANEVRIADGIVEVDVNADGVADLAIRVDYELGRSDFWL